MKKVLSLLALLLAFSSVGFGQGSGPITVREVDGSPRVNGLQEFVFPNGSLTVSGKRVTVAGGGGSPGGSNTQLQYNNSSSFGGISGATSDGTNVTFGSGNLIATSPAFTTSATVTRNSLGTTTAAGIELVNTTDAAAGAQQVSPAIIWTSEGWKTNATAASQVVNWQAYVLPVQGAANATANLTFASQINGGGYAVGVSFISDKTLNLSDGWALAFSNTATGAVGGNGITFFYNSASDSARLNVRRTGNTTDLYAFGYSGLNMGTSQIGFGASVVTASQDLILRRAAAANLAFGAADAASPVAQTLSVQNVVAGTSNTAGANWTLNGSRGTGTGAGGDIIFQTAPAGSSGTSQNALSAAFTVNNDGTISPKTVTFANLPTVGNGKMIFCSDCTIASPCASGGSGAFAKGINGAWVCN